MRPARNRTERVIDNDKTSWQDIGAAISLSGERTRQIYMRTMAKMWVVAEELGMHPEEVDLKTLIMIGLSKWTVIKS